MIALVVVLAALIGLVGAGQVARARLARAHPAPGELVDIGGHRLHLHRSGSGPTVVFDAGAGGTSPDWSLVRAEADRFATTIAYDRAGLGWSDPGPRPRTLLREVAELHAALEACGASPPFVLVGHSWGGLVVRAFAYQHPDEVAGLVLVDTAHEEQFSYYPAEYVERGRRMGRTMRRLAWAAPIVFGSGIPAILASRATDARTAMLPAEAAGRRRATGLMGSRQARAIIDEFATLEDGLEEMRRIRHPLGDLPLVIVSHGIPVNDGVPDHLQGEVEDAWQRMQFDLAAQSTKGVLVHAERSGHDIPVAQPEVVVDAIHRVLTTSHQV